VLQGINATNSLLKHLIPSKKFIETCLDKNMDHFRKTVDRNLSLPLNRLEDVMILNTSLIDLDLSVSLVGLIIILLHRIVPVRSFYFALHLVRGPNYGSRSHFVLFNFS
jgi:hypothetical protein